MYEDNLEDYSNGTSLDYSNFAQEESANSSAAANALEEEGENGQQEQQHLVKLTTLCMHMHVFTDE